MTSFAAPRKALGQNFLQDANIINKIVGSLNLQPDDVVMEIGPGRGALTEPLLAQAKQVHVVEFDRDLSRYWQARAKQTTNLVVHAEDILKFDVSTITTTTNSPIKVIGNLPYNISSPVLFHLMPWAEQLHSQTVMLQKEVVDRMVATPNDKSYGRLSVMLQQQYEIESLFRVPANAFFPAPKVTSAIARLTPRVDADLSISAINDFSHLVKHAFLQRRKTLRNSLKTLLSAAQIETLNIDPGARAETLSVAQFSQLANLYSSLKKTV